MGRKSFEFGFLRYSTINWLAVKGRCPLNVNGNGVDSLLFCFLANCFWTSREKRFLKCSATTFELKEVERYRFRLVFLFVSLKFLREHVKETFIFFDLWAHKKKFY